MKKTYASLRSCRSTARSPPKILRKRLVCPQRPAGVALKSWRKNRVISSTVAVLDREKLGLDWLVIAGIILTSNDPSLGREFSEMVANRAEIVECYVMSGEYDFNLKIACKNMKTYQKLLKEHILLCKAVRHVHTSFVMQVDKYTTALPLEK